MRLIYLKIFLKQILSDFKISIHVYEANTRKRASQTTQCDISTVLQWKSSI